LNDATGIARRVSALRRIEGERRSELPPTPKSAKIELDSACDLACTFCTRTLRPRVRSRMSPDVFRRIVLELRAAGVDQLGLFYMNEPFLVEELAEAVRWTKQEAGMPYVFLTTNGVAAHEASVRACIEAGLDSLKFALNFGDSAQFRSAADAVAFNTVVGNVRAARRARDEVERASGHECRLSASSLDLGADHRARMAPLLGTVARLVDEHYWLPLFGRSDLAPTDCAATAAVLERKPSPCWTLFTEAHVRADGRLSACCLDASDRFVMADLNATSFASAWHGEAFRALRAAHLRGDLTGTACEQCIGFDEQGAGSRAGRSEGVKT